MPIDKQRDYAVEDQDRRAEKRLGMFVYKTDLIGSCMRFDKEKEIKENKHEKIK